MSETTTLGLIDKLVDHVLDTPFSAFSSEVITAGKHRILDALSCTVSGAGVEGNDAYSATFMAWGGNEQATVLGSGDKLPLPYAAVINSLQTRSFDFEVCGPEPEGANKGKMVGHVASTNEPVALNTAEFFDATGEEFLSAVIIGGDVAARISVSNTFNFDADFEVCGTSNAFGATATVGRLMGLSKPELKNAFGILLNLMSGSYQGIWDGAHAFKQPGAQAAYNAILACQLSQNGFKGVDDALESRLGFFHLYAPDPHPENFLVDLGEIFYVKGQHKLHPSCYGNHNPIDTILELRDKHGFEASDVDKVTIAVPPNRIDHFLNQVPTKDDSQPKFLFTIPYGVANALLRGRPELEHYVAPAIYEPEVLDLASRVILEPTLPLGNNHLVNIIVTLKDGTEHVLERANPAGWLDNPATEEQLVEKFWRNLKFFGDIDEKEGNKALQLILDIENQSNVHELVQTLTK